MFKKLQTEKESLKGKCTKYRIVNNVLFNLKKTFKLSNLNLLGDIMVALSPGLRTFSFQRSPTGKLLYFPEIPGFTHC